MPIDIEYDEGYNPPRPECLASINVNERWYKATKRALPWRMPADGNAARRVTPLVWLEGCVRDAAPEDPAALAGIPFLTRCLQLDSVAEKLGHLDYNGVLDTRADDPDDAEVHEFESLTHLYRATDAEMMKIKGTPEGQFGAADIDHFDAHDPAHGALQLLEDLDFEKLVREENSFRAYWELSCMLGGRAIAASRLDGACLLMHVGSTGAQLMKVMETYYDATGAQPAFLAPRIPKFLAETRWLYPYNIDRPSFDYYAFDLPSRARWGKASRSDWPALVQNKIDESVSHLGVLSSVLHDQRGAAALLTRDVQAVGDMVLGGEASARMPLLRIDEIEQRLSDPHDGVSDYVAAQRGAGASTQDIIKGIKRIFGGSASGDKEREHKESEHEIAMAGPKRAQVERATAEASFAKLEVAWYDVLREEGQPKKDNFAMFDDCFRARSVLAKAVLLRSPGARLSVYGGVSDFLDLLKDESDYLPIFFGQSVAFDVDDDEVPAALESFVLDAGQLDLLRAFRWDEMDPLNHILLKLKAEETTAAMPHHDLKKLYHYGEATRLVAEVNEKLWCAYGYPATVPRMQGLSYGQFMRLIRKLQDARIGMDSDRAAKMNALIDRLVTDAHRAAGASARRIIYGTSPAEKRLGPWLEADTPVFKQLMKAIDGIKTASTLRSALPDVYGTGDKGAPLSGFGSSHEASTSGVVREGKGTGKPKTKPDATPDGKKPPTKPGNQWTAKEKIEFNPKHVYYYDDGKYSKGQLLVDWPAICEDAGWDPTKVCGPFTLSANGKVKGAAFDCLDPQHT